MARGGYLGFSSWKMSLSVWLIEVAGYFVEKFVNKYYS